MQTDFPVDGAQLIGRPLSEVVATVDAYRVHLFRTAIGAGAAAPGAPIPPTYLFALEMQAAPSPFFMLEELGIGISEILHAEQAFSYHRPIRAGDRLTFRGQISDVFEKKGGALQFIVQDVVVSDADDQVVAELRKTFVIPRQARS